MRSAGNGLNHLVQARRAHLDEYFARLGIGIGKRLILWRFAQNIYYRCIHRTVPSTYELDRIDRFSILDVEAQ
jgi:hypothetical protein